MLALPRWIEYPVLTKCLLPFPDEFNLRGVRHYTWAEVWRAPTHLIPEGQKVVVGQNRGRCMVIMLQTRVKHGCLTSTRR